MKKILALLSVFVLSMSMFVGCGSSKATNDELVVYFVHQEIQKKFKVLQLL